MGHKVAGTQNMVSPTSQRLPEKNVILNPFAFLSTFRGYGNQYKIQEIIKLVILLNSAMIRDVHRM